MNKIEFETALADAQGDADIMLGVCMQRIKVLEALVDWAETMLCNADSMLPCAYAEWLAGLKRWRDAKNGMKR